MPQKRFRGLSAFAAFLDEAPTRIRISQAEAAKFTAARMLLIAHGLYGEDPPLAPLMESTQEERSSLGYEPDQPLLRDGSLLRDSVRAVATPTIGTIVSDQPITAYHEFGYVTQPFGNPFAESVSVVPRPVFRETLLAVEPYVVELNGRVAKAAFGMEE